MVKANTLSKGMIVSFNDEPHIVRQIETQSPSSRGAQTLYKVRYDNLTTRQKSEQTHTGDQKIAEIDFKKTRMQFLYQNGDHYVFMDTEDYVQYEMSAAELAEKKYFLTEGESMVNACLVEGRLADIELPASVDLAITETAPAVKGSTGSGRKKPAVLESGLEVNVPEYLATGDRIKVNTETLKYMSKAD